MAIRAALSTVTDPETGQPITELGYVAAVTVDAGGVGVHLRLPKAPASPNFAYLVASDAQDALSGIEDFGEVQVVLDGHRDSERINAGLAARAGHPAESGENAEEQRLAFLRTAHAAAMQRCITLMLRRNMVQENMIHLITLRDLPNGREKAALLRRRFALGFSMCPNGRVLVDGEGHPVTAR